MNSGHDKQYTYSVEQARAGNPLANPSGKRYISTYRRMHTVLTHIRTAVLILVHLVMVFGLEAGHTERFLVSGSGPETVTSHDCGASERHITLDHLHSCQACVFQLQHNGVSPEPGRLDGGREYAVAIPLPVPLIPPLPTFYHSGLRGPPCA